MRVERVRVGDVLALQRRAVDVDPLAGYVEIGVRSFGKGIFHKEPLTGADLGAKRVFRIEPGDLVISNVFAWEGAVALATQAERGTIGSHRFMTFTPASDAIDSAWASWFFRSEPGLERIRKASPGSAGRNRTLAIARFENLVIPLPPIEEQRRVAAHLDRLRDQATRALAEATRASAITRALSISACARPDLTDKEKSNAGWRYVNLGTLMAPAVDRVSVTPERSYPNLGIYGFGRGVFEKAAIDGASTSATSLYRVRSGQFIYSRLFAFEGAYAHVPARFDDYFVSNEFPSFAPDPERLDARWLATYMSSPDRWAELAGSSKGLGVRRQRVPVQAILDFRVWAPPINRQREMVRAIEALDTASAARTGVMARLHALLPSAMNQAFADLT